MIINVNIKIKVIELVNNKYIYIKQKKKINAFCSE